MKRDGCADCARPLPKHGGYAHMGESPRCAKCFHKGWPGLPLQRLAECGIVHFCDYASQPDIRIACDQKWTTPYLAPGEVRIDRFRRVFPGMDGRSYTFEKTRVTCPKCKEKSG
jgi:hypothetical protein